MKSFIYSLEHIYTDELHTDCKLLGFFDDINELEKAKDVVSKFSGFRKYPNGFKIIKNELNKVHWEKGFHNVVGEIGRDYLPEEDEINGVTYLVQNLKSIIYFCHVYKVDDNTDDERVIGVFSDLSKVEQVLEKLKIQTGFKNYPENFIIEDIAVNVLLWSSGF